MFRNNRYGGLLTVILIFAALTIVSFAAFQMGVAQGAAGEFARPENMPQNFTGPVFWFFPFFWGFGLLKLFFWLLVIGVFLRVVFRISGFRGHPNGPWGHGREERLKHWKETHDRWHTEVDDPQMDEDFPSTAA